MSSLPKPAFHTRVDGIFQLSLMTLFDVLRKGTKKVSELLALKKDYLCIRTIPLLL